MTARVEAQARSWVVYLNSGDVTPGKLAEFEEWLAADPAHALAYRDCEQILVDVALPCEMMDLGDPEAPDIANESSPGRVPTRSIAAGLLVAVAVFAVTIGFLPGFFASSPKAGNAVEQPAEPPAFATQIAEIRDVTLPDGSLVTLGAKSSIDYRFDDTLRTVVLQQGEAFFDVVPDKTRPFYVQVGDRLVRVVGTRFDVRQSSGSVTVSVVEGIVEVIKAGDPETAEIEKEQLDKDVLTAGDKVIAIIGEDVRELEEVDPSKAASWRNGWLAYENTTLREIVSDIYRYDGRNFIFTTADLEDVRVTAAFGADKVDQFLVALEASYPIIVDQNDPSSVILRPAN